MKFKYLYTMNTVQLHTVFLLVGPHHCGKTTFSKTKLVPKLQELTSGEANIQYLSTDDIRRTLIGRPDLDKLQTTMLEVSKQAFDLLYHLLGSLTSFPVNAHFIIIDSTGLSPDFRQNISDICQKNSYNLDLIFFNYTEKDYFSHGGDKQLITKHVIKYRRAMTELKSLTVHAKHYLKDHTVNLDGLTLGDWDLYRSLKLNADRSYFVIGDLHTCLEEFQALVRKAGFVIDEEGIVRPGPKTNGSEIVLVGDLIDKGAHTKGTVDFFYRNLKRDDNLINIVVGNHEQTVHGLLTGKRTEHQYDGTLLRDHFNSYFEMKVDLETKNKFLWLYEKMRPFLWYRSEDTVSKSFIVTHAPCPHRRLGKLDRQSLKVQSYCHLDRQKEFWSQFYQIIGTNCESKVDSVCYPYHIFGHAALVQPYFGTVESNSRIGLDTGCIHGNYLTGVWLGKRFTPGKPYFVKQSFLGTQAPAEGVPHQLPREKKEDNTGPSATVTASSEGINGRLATLSPDNQRRIRHLIRNQINFISGTISPANKDETGGILESLEQGLLYYQRHGVKEVVIQTKYMGSRCNVYLDAENPENSFSVSRNGYKISENKVPHEQMMERIYRPLLARLDTFIKEHKIKQLIVDGELMPWSALGGGLIDNTFRVIDTCLHQELDILGETGFPKLFGKTCKQVHDSGFGLKSHNTKKSDLKKDFGDATFGTYESVLLLQKQGVQFDLAHEKEQASVYHRQVEIFGAQSELHFKPFNILKVIFQSPANDGTGARSTVSGTCETGNVVPFYPNDILHLSQNEIFTLVSDDTVLREHHLLNLEGENAEVSFKWAREFYDQLTGDDYEGVVIKPNHYPEELNYAPFLKVRNSRYLSIIYGYNYQEPRHYTNLVKQKNIAKKVRNSIRDYNLGLKMLQTPKERITEENSQYVKLLVDFVFGEEDTKDIDPRL